MRLCWRFAFSMSMLLSTRAFSMTKFLQKRINLKCFLTTTIHVVGRKNSVEDFIASGVLEYEKRLTPVLETTTVFHKSDEELVRAFPNMKGTVFALDENGATVTSRGFADLLYQGLEAGGSHVSFIIGGFDGLPKEIKGTCKSISLSKMTWTHQMARLLLMEQIYRATEIRKNSKYHKD